LIEWEYKVELLKRITTKEITIPKNLIEEEANYFDLKLFFGLFTFYYVCKIVSKIMN
jgi:hypothetical protein